MTSSPTREAVEAAATLLEEANGFTLLEKSKGIAGMLRALLARAEAAERERDDALSRLGYSALAAEEQRQAAAEFKAERDAARAEVARLSEALRPFAQAAQIYHDAIQNFVVEGETLTERRFSAGERADRARELASEHLASLPVEALLEARAALAGETGR